MKTKKLIKGPQMWSVKQLERKAEEFAALPENRLNPKIFMMVSFLEWLATQ